jgi:hypothetical protein
VQPRHAPPRRPSRPVVLLGAGTLALIGLNLWWYWTYRRGFPLQLDEAGYSALALALTQALTHHGIGALFHSFETQQTVFGPFVPLVTVPLNVVVGSRVGNGYVALEAFYGVLVVTTYGIARRFVSPAMALLAALLVATAPEVVMFTRAYYFAVPAAALLTTAVWCLLRSEGLRRTGWVLVAGAVLGVSLLTRTHLVSLVPCVFAAAALQVVVAGVDVRRRLVTLLAAAGVAAAIAGVWYVRNAGDAIGFLIGTRYRVVTPTQGIGQLGPLLRFLMQLVDTTQLPTALILLVVAVAAATRWRRGRDNARRRRLRTAMADARVADAWLLATVLAAFVTVFAVGEFVGGVVPAGEWLLALPIVVAGAIAALASLGDGPRRAAATLLVVVALVNTVMMSGVAPAVAAVRTVDAGPFGLVTVTDGRQFLQVSWNHFQPGPPGRLPFAAGAAGHVAPALRAVRPLLRGVDAWLLRDASRHGERPVVFAVGPDSRFLNINSLALEDRLLESNGTLITGRVEVPVAASIAQYCQQLDDPRLGLPNYLFLFRGAIPGAGLAARSVGVRRVERLGFRLVRPVAVPDGVVEIYWRSQGDVPTTCPR